MDILNLIGIYGIIKILIAILITIYFIILLCIIIEINKNLKELRKDLKEFKKDINKNQELNQLYLKQYVVLLNKISDSLNEEDSEPYIIKKED